MQRPRQDRSWQRKRAAVRNWQSREAGQPGPTADGRWASLGVVGALAAPSLAAAADAPRRPNIVIILGDDLGFADMGSFGSEIKTPNLDALAKDGVRFSELLHARELLAHAIACC